MPLIEDLPLHAKSRVLFIDNPFEVFHGKLAGITLKQN